MAVKTYSLAKDGNTSLSANFKVREFRSKCGSDTILIDSDLVDKLQQLRNWAGASITINSGYRTPEHNTAVGGESNSYHMKGKAADIAVSGKTPSQVSEKARQIFKGVIKYNTFTHVDTRTTTYHPQ